MEIDLSGDDLKIIASAITWTLYVPFTRSLPPSFSTAECAQLQGVFDSICRHRHADKGIIGSTISREKFIVNDSTLASTAIEIDNIITCVVSFRNEIGHSPFEVSAVTGLPVSQLDSVVERLSMLKRDDNG